MNKERREVNDTMLVMAPLAVDLTAAAIAAIPMVYKGGKSLAAFMTAKKKKDEEDKNNSSSNK